jgi:L-ascorbate metabolism protein UlaG (beta-lactamase superfamily)
MEACPMIRSALFALILAASPAQAQDRIPSHCIALAQGIARVMPAAFADPVEADHVRIRFLDHASFAIRTEGGLTAVTDYTGFIGVTDFVPDVVTMNNAHRTHWTDAPDPRIAHVLPGWDEFGDAVDHRLDLGGMLVRNVATDTRDRAGRVRANGNSIFIFEAAGLCIGHLGHLHHIPDEAQFAAIGRLDVVMVPVDGGYTMNVADMGRVVSRLRSSVVLPMHWFSGASLDQFLTDMAGEFEVVRPGISQIDLSLKKLPSRPTIMVLEPEWLP